MLPHYEEWLRHGDWRDPAGRCAERSWDRRRSLPRIRIAGWAEGVISRSATRNARETGWTRRRRNSTRWPMRWNGRAAAGTLGHACGSRAAWWKWRTAAPDLAEGPAGPDRPGSKTGARLCSRCAPSTIKNRRRCEVAQSKTTHWREKLPAGEVHTALRTGHCESKAASCRCSIPRGGGCVQVMNARYDFSKHAVRPTWKQVLGELAAEHCRRGRACRAVRERASSEFACDDLGALRTELQTLTAEPGIACGARVPRAASQFDRRPELVESAGRARAAASTGCAASCTICSQAPDGHSIAAISEAVRDMREEADALPEVAARPA